jgi:hypothetical protein
MQIDETAPQRKIGPSVRDVAQKQEKEQEGDLYPEVLP